MDENLTALVERVAQAAAQGVITDVAEPAEYLTHDGTVEWRIYATTADNGLRVYFYAPWGGTP